MVASLLYGVHIALLPLLLLGFIRRSKARLQNRVGPPLLQPFRDVAKLLHKGETVSDATTAVFRTAPLLALSAAVGAACMVPWLGTPPPLAADLFVLVYVLAVGRFALGLSALDTGSSFGALGASRDATVSIQAEPTLVLALAALAVHARSSSLSDMFLTGHASGHILLLVPLLAVSLWLAAMAELSRMPIDDPTTHLELTMIHEALLLENSGRNLAIVEFATALKMTVLLGLVGQVVLVLAPVSSPAMGYLTSIGLLWAGAVIIVVGESTMVKLRWRRIPNMLSFGLMASTLACLLVAMEG